MALISWFSGGFSWLQNAIDGNDLGGLVPLPDQILKTFSRRQSDFVIGNSQSGKGRSPFRRGNSVEPGDRHLSGNRKALPRQMRIQLVALVIRSANPGSHSLAGLARSKLMNLINRKSACGGWIDNPIGIPRKLQPGRLGKESGMTVLSPLGRKIVAGSQKSDSFVPQLHQMIQNQLNAPVVIDVDAIQRRPDKLLNERNHRKELLQTKNDLVRKRINQKNPVPFPVIQRSDFGVRRRLQTGFPGGYEMNVQLGL